MLAYGGLKLADADRLLEVFPGRAFQERPQLPGTRWMPQFLQRLGLDLADTFPRDRERLWGLRLRQVDFEPVLHRPLENTPFFGSWPRPPSLATTYARYTHPGTKDVPRERNSQNSRRA